MVQFVKKFSLSQSTSGLLVVFAVSFSPHSVRADADHDDDDAAAKSLYLAKRPIEELFKTDNVYPQMKGELEVELESIYQNGRTGSDAWTIPLSLEYGLTDLWQVEAEWNALVQNFPKNHSAVRGIGDIEVGTQYSFMNVGDSLFHVAPRFSIEIPVGDVNKDFSEGFLEYEPAVIIARDFPELHHSQIFTEIGANLVQRINRPADADDAEPAAHELNFGAGFFVLFPHNALTMEFNLNDNQWNHHGTEYQMYLTPGCLWRVAPEVEIGLGIPVGLNNTSDRFQVIAHVVWEF